METPEKNILATAATRKANLRLFVGMIVFALVFTGLCILWLHLRSEKIYQEQSKGSSRNPLDSGLISC